MTTPKAEPLFIVEDSSGLLDLLGQSAAGDRLPYAASKWSSMLRVDVDALPNAETVAAIELGKATDSQRDEYAQHHERQWLSHYAELQRVRHDVRPDDVVAAELVRLRGENERMRAVCEAACDWATWSSTGRRTVDLLPSNAHDYLRNAVDRLSRRHHPPRHQAVERHARHADAGRVVGAVGSASTNRNTRVHRHRRSTPRSPGSRHRQAPRVGGEGRWRVMRLTNHRRSMKVPP